MRNKSNMFGDETVVKLCGGLRKQHFEHAKEYGIRCWKAFGKRFDLIVFDCGNGWYQLVKKIKV